MKVELSNLKTPIDIHWLRMNVQPVKIQIVQFAGMWESKYSSFLLQFAEDRIATVNDFVDKVITGLTAKSAVDDPDNEQLLYATMTHIRDVKLAMSAMKLMFQPIREECQLLKKHHMAVSDTRLQQLEQAPARWEEVIRAAFDEKEKILPLQNIEMLKIRRKIDAFATQVTDFRSEILANCPFTEANAVAGEYDASYKVLDEYYLKTIEIMKAAKEYNNLELLFDMQMSNYRALKESIDDLVLLKNLWDAIVLVKETFLDWHATLWEKINTDDMLMRVKDLQLQVKNMPKGMRGWKLYNWLVEEVKNMSTVLPLINDLHSDTRCPTTGR
jgi:dynein heavy chain